MVIDISESFVSYHQNATRKAGGGVANLIKEIIQKIRKGKKISFFSNLYDLTINPSTFQYSVIIFFILLQ